MITLTRATVIFFCFFLFLIAGSVTSYFAFQREEPSVITNQIAANLRYELEIIDEQVDDVLLLIDSPSLRTSAVKNRDYPFFIYEKDSLIYWSDNDFVPSAQQLRDSFYVKLIKTATEAFLAKKIKADQETFIIALISLRTDYLINNDYLEPEWNGRILPSGNIAILDNSSPSGFPVCLRDECLFKIRFLSEDYPSRKEMKILSVTLLFAACIFLVAIVYIGLRKVSTKYPEAGVLYLFISFFALRTLMTSMSFPGVFVRMELFDPQIFRVSNLNASLGDLLINTIAVLAICYYIFKNFYRFKFIRDYKQRTIQILLAAFYTAGILFAGLFPFVVVQTIYNNSSIVLDITQSLNLDYIRIIAIVTVVISGACTFLFLHVCIQLLRAERRLVNTIMGILVGFLLFIVVNFLTGQSFVIATLITIVHVVVILFFELSKSLLRLTYATFSYLVISIVMMSASGAFAIQYFSHKEKIENQFRFASHFLVDRDYFAEFLLHEASQKIGNDAFIQARIASPFLGKDAIAQKVRQIFLPSYFNKYDVRISIFNGKGDPLDGTSGSDLTEIIQQYNKDAFKTPYDGIYVVNNPASDVTQKYLILEPVERTNMIIGYVVVELSLKKIIPENVYPELLVDYRFQQFYRTQDLSYALFGDNEVVFSSGGFNYELSFNRNWLNDERVFTTGLTRGGYDHIAQEDSNGRIALVSSPTSSIGYKVANFSFLFGLGLLIILFLIFLQGIYNYFKGTVLFFSARIQLYLNLAFFVPLIIVSVSILGLTSRASQLQLDAEYISKSRVFGQQITPSLVDFEASKELSALNSRLTDLATLSMLDANLYYENGRLMATSQPLIFESHLISTFINPHAFDKIKKGETSFILSEQIGKLKYFIAYTAIRSPQTADLLGILGIPFFQSAYLTEKAQIVIFANIVNIFAFIFITLLVLSYFVSSWLTFPLRFITQSLRRTSLTRINEPLTWNSEDEIGLMVREYNSMLYKLSESKNQLEHTQREKAWREIAQQVAHEIKNPLTPMKLTLQRLQRSLDEQTMDTTKTQKAIEVLLSQVDTLNEIASSFSGFAKMPELVMKKVDLVSTVKRVVDLHSSSGEITFKTEEQEVFVMGDEQMLDRIFSNLIINGLQSGNPGQTVRIQVIMNRRSNFIRVEINDNGKGIEQKISELVFLPHFSTKKSGSGIGLAISKQGIEQMGGKIWFETKVGKGTSFFVELPV